MLYYILIYSIVLYYTLLNYMILDDLTLYYVMLCSIRLSCHYSILVHGHLLGWIVILGTVLFPVPDAPVQNHLAPVVYKDILHEEVVYMYMYILYRHTYTCMYGIYVYIHERQNPQQGLFGTNAKRHRSLQIAILTVTITNNALVPPTAGAWPKTQRNQDQSGAHRVVPRSA